MTQSEAIEQALIIGCAVTGLSSDQMLFSDTFEGYLDMVCQRFDVIQDEPATKPEISDTADYLQMCESLRRGEG